MRAGRNKVADNLIYVGPDFIHEFGDSAHHMSMMRTVECEIDEDGDEADYIPGTGPPNWRFKIHEDLDYYVFYPIVGWIRKFVGDNDLGQLLREILGFFWGLNCGFPHRDALLYTIWTFHGCKPLAVYERVDGKWVKTYESDGARCTLNSRMGIEKV